ncbi:MAG: hypothetical protein Q7U51_06775 [Methanoregula sp.]|nr:hypothetical protein [Methanoregula sp.]
MTAPWVFTFHVPIRLGIAGCVVTGDEGTDVTGLDVTYVAGVDVFKSE